MIGTMLRLLKNTKMNIDTGVFCLLYRLPETSEITYYEKQFAFLFWNTKIHFSIEAIRALINTIQVKKIKMKRITIIFKEKVEWMW